MPATDLTSSTKVVVATSAAEAGAPNTAALPASPGKMTYITGFTVTTSNPRKTVSGIVSVVGTVGHLAYTIVESAESGCCLSIQFSKPIPASAPNTRITVNVPAIEGGGSNTVAVQGFQE